jgi:putative ubiquitin-RnfH superfamily antitoxin RatB of RatAB toxin-antitoxin module
MAAPECPAVEVVYALAEKQRVVAVEYANGMTAGCAVELSGLVREFPELAAGAPDLGIYGRVVPQDHPLRPGDRVEIYRRLKADPRETRRRLAAAGNTMGRPAGSRDR